MAKHLIGAIRDFLGTRSALMAQLKGGISDGQAGRDDALPYLILESKDMHSMRIMGGKEIQFHRIEFTVHATSRATAETLGNQVRDLILPPQDAPPWTPLSLLGGWIDLNRQPAGGDAIEIDPETKAALGKDVWACSRPITWTISRG